MEYWCDLPGPQESGSGKHESKSVSLGNLFLCDIGINPETPSTVIDLMLETIRMCPALGFSSPALVSMTLVPLIPTPG